MKKFAVLLVIALLSSPVLTIGKKRHRYIVPQFEFTQIDSLLDDGISKRVTADSTSFVVGYVWWPVGNYVNARKKYAPYKNHFEIYFMFKRKKKFFIQKVDNFGFFKIRKFKGVKLKNYTHEFGDDMAGEVLKPRIDTIFNDDGSIKGTMHALTDHHLYEEVRILSETSVQQFDYNTDYSANKANLATYKYGLLKLLGQKRTHFNKRKHRRVSVVWRDVSEE